jgi:dipeptidyl aminopeptidase/acylaminoacyl peptidase
MKAKVLLLAGMVVVVLLIAGYLAFEYYVFSQLTVVDPTSSINLPNTPDDFKVRGGPHIDFDTTPYEMASYEAVRFPSRQAGVQLAGWYVATEPSAPAVLLTHGLRQCKCDSNVLTAAGMLHRNGYNVLLIDLRNHGQSDVVNGRAGFGGYEYRDVLGAWDWLISAKGFSADRIGLYGVSMGAATTLIVLGQEPRVAAAFVDSPFYDVGELLADELGRMGIPSLLAPGSLWIGRVVTGDDLLLHSPQEGLREDNGRPIYLVHGTIDGRIDVRHHYEYEALARATGADVTNWVVDGAGHVESAFVAPVEYEQRLVDFFGNALEK